MAGLIGMILGLIIGLVVVGLLSRNHVTRIIEVIIGCIYLYFSSIDGLLPEIDFIMGMGFTSFFIIVFSAVGFAIYEVWCLVKFVLEGAGFDTSSKPSPYSHAMGGLANLIMSFFR